MELLTFARLRGARPGLFVTAVRGRASNATYLCNTRASTSSILRRSRERKKFKDSILCGGPVLARLSRGNPPLGCKRRRSCRAISDCDRPAIFPPFDRTITCSYEVGVAGRHQQLQVSGQNLAAPGVDQSRGGHAA